MNLKNIFKSDNFLYLLFFLLPFTFLIGPAFVNTCVALLCIFFLIVYFTKNNKKDLINISIIIVYSVWIFYLIINSLFSENIILSLEGSLFYFRYGIFFLAILYLFQNKYYSKFFFICILISIIILCFDAVFQYYFRENLIGLRAHSTRISSFFGKEFILGHHLSKLLPLVLGLYLFFFSETKYKNLIIFLILFFTSFVILISGDRSAFIFLLITMLFTFYYFLRTSKISFIVFFFILISFLVIIFSFSVNVKNRFIDNSLSEIYSKNEFRFYSHQHELHFRSAFKMFLDKPIFGVGPKLFRHHCLDKKYFIKEKMNLENEHFLTGCSTSPHNLTLQLLAEVGLVGFLPVFFLIIILIYKLSVVTFSKKYNNNFFLMFVYLSCLVNLSPITPSGNIFGSYLSTMIYLNLSIALYLSKIKNENNKF